jgi:centrin-3
LRALGFDVKKAEVLKLMREYDPEESGKIQYSDFVDLSSHFPNAVTRKYSERDPTDEIMRAYKLFVGDDAMGKINLRCLRKISKELGEELSEEELQAMIDEFDHDGDGCSRFCLYIVNQDEFLAIMKQTSIY